MSSARPTLFHMGTVSVSAQRMSSMLSNRNRTPADLAAATTLTLDPGACVAEDSALTFEDLIHLGKFFKRPWSYLLIDAPEVISSEAAPVGQTSP